MLWNKLDGVMSDRSEARFSSHAMAIDRDRSHQGPLPCVLLCLREFSRRGLINILILFLVGETSVQSAYGSDEFAVFIRLDQPAMVAIPQALRPRLSIKRDSTQDAANMGNMAPPGRAVPLIFIVIGVLSLPIIYRTIREMVRQYYYGGVLIDLRSQPPRIVNDLKVPADMVFILKQDGSIEQFKSEDFLEDVLDDILRGSLARKLKR